jgi:acetylornithine deacetylase
VSAQASVAAGVASTVAAHGDDFVEALLELVRVPSVNPAYPGGTGEAAVQARLGELLDGWRVPWSTWEPQPEHHARFVADEPHLEGRAYAGRPNLEAVLGDPEATGGLLLNSHVDTVDAAPEGFRPTIADGRIRGRGAMDAKGSVAAMACALAVVRELDVELAAPVRLLAVCDEEAGGGGTLAAIGRGLTADGAIVGEATNLRLCPATRSSRRLRVAVDGVGAHPGEAFLGTNAIEKAMLLVEAIREEARRLDREHPHALWDHLPVQHVFNLCWLSGGAPLLGSVPDRCEFEVASGGTAAETLEELQASVEAAIAAAAAADPWLAEHPPELTWNRQRLYPAFTAADHPLVVDMADAARSATGRPAQVTARSGVTDMRHLVRYASLPSVTFGPGSMHVAHTAGESVDIEEYLMAIEILAGTIVRRCGA